MTTAMSHSAVSTEARKFLETTSIRGVPRIIKSKSKILFAIWLLAVLTCAGVLIWQLTLIFIKYSKYPVNTMFLQAPNAQKPTFPDVTVCNLCPLVHEVEMSLTYNDYVNTLENAFTYEKAVSYVEAAFNDNLTEEFYEFVYNDLLLSPPFYYSNFPISTSRTLNENKAPTLACSFYGWDYLPVGGDCMTTVLPIWDANYYKCYKFALSEPDNENVRGFSAIFYLNKYLENQMTGFSYDLTSSHATGLRVTVHAPGTVPQMNYGMNINPGMETTFSISQTVLSHLPSPYSACTDQKTIGALDEITTYSQDYCYDACIQQQFVELCRCIWGQRQFTPQQLVDVNYTVCGNMSLNEKDSNVSWSGFADISCAYTAMGVMDAEKCFRACANPCTTYDYSMSISSAAWPHISSQVSFYDSFIRNNPRFGTAFDGYEQLVTNKSLSGPASTALLKSLNREGLIANSFLQLKVVFDSETFDVRKDAAAIPVEALGAQIGGVLSLWLGVTVMLVVEVLEFLFTLIGVCYQSRRRSSVIQVQSAGELKENVQ